MSDMFVNMARRIFQDPTASRKRLELAGSLLLNACKRESSVVGQSEVTVQDMLRCLDFGDMVAEYGARCLYIRTGRDGLGWSPAESNGLPFIVDRADWERYLHEHYYKTAA
jgi:hypothetical protein